MIGYLLALAGDNHRLQVDCDLHPAADRALGLNRVVAGPVAYVVVPAEQPNSGGTGRRAGSAGA